MTIKLWQKTDQNAPVTNSDHKLYELLPPRNNCESNLRRKRNFNVPLAKTKRLKNTFICSNCNKIFSYICVQQQSNAGLRSPRQSCFTYLIRLYAPSFSELCYFEIHVFQGVHEKVLLVHHKASDALKATTADNRVLISQHQNALQREREQWNNRMAEQERMLEIARSEMAQEVAREKEKQEYLEHEK